MVLSSRHVGKDPPRCIGGTLVDRDKSGGELVEGSGGRCQTPPYRIRYVGLGYPWQAKNWKQGLLEEDRVQKLNLCPAPTRDPTEVVYE